MFEIIGNIEKGRDGGLEVIVGAAMGRFWLGGANGASSRLDL